MKNPAAVRRIAIKLMGRKEKKLSVMAGSHNKQPRSNRP
jgi:hypothetical protein